MKLILLLTFYCLIQASFGQTLNDSVCKAQRKAIKVSPYKDAKGFAVSKFQTQFRQTKFPKIISNLLFDKTNLVDTLWMVESFDELCSNCSSYSSDLLYEDSLYSYNDLSGDFNNRKKFTAMQFDMNQRLYNNIIMEIVDSVRQKHNWLFYPLHYGSNYCNDGDHTIVTIVYPDRHIESLYVRCWKESEYRKK